MEKCNKKGESAFIDVFLICDEFLHPGSKNNSKSISKNNSKNNSIDV